jgi:AcrR family transcriptional regulator
MGRIKTTEEAVTRREVIVEKAAHLFKEKGFKASSMRELADSVGVEAASLYNHISSKNEMLSLICYNVANKYMQKIEEIEALPITVIEKIEKLLRFHINGMLTNFEQVYVTDREWKHLQEPYLNNFKNQRKVYRKRFAALIEQGIKQKEIKKIDAPTAVLILLHAVSGIESWHRSNAKISGKSLEENMVTILVNGLKK